MTPTLPKAQTHAERLRMLVDEGFAPVRDHAAIMAGAAALDEVQRLRRVLQLLADNKLSGENCANPEVAGRRVAAIARAALLETP